MGWLAAVLIVAGLSLHGVGTFNPDPPKWLAIYGFFLVFSIWLFFAKPKMTPVVWALLALLGWCLVSLLWAPDWRAGALRLQHLVALSGVYCWVLWSRHPLKAILPAVTISVISTGMLYFYHDQKVWAGYGNEVFLAEYLILSLPFCLCAILSSRRWVQVCGIFATMAGLILLTLNLSDTRWAALGGFCVLGLLWYRKYFYAALSVLIPLNGALLAGWFSGETLSSIRDRAEIWYNTFVMWLDYPFFGVGIGNFNYVYYRYQEMHTEVFTWGTLLKRVNVYAGAAHNEGLQMLAELGVVGLLLLLIFTTLCLYRSRSGLGLSILACALAVGSLGFPTQNPATALLIAMGMGLAAREVRYPAYRTVGARIGGVLVSIPAALWGGTGLDKDQRFRRIQGRNGRARNIPA